MAMTKRQFAKYLARDMHCPCGCMGREETYVPQHRKNRGLGGSKLLDTPSNIIVMCSELNGLIESNADLAAQAEQFGWKLKRWQDPAETPVFDRATGEWSLIDDDFNKTILGKRAA